MKYEEQDILGMDDGRRRQVTWNRRDGVEEASSKLEIENLSGMCLDALPNPSMNLATICKLDISNNNLQLHPSWNRGCEYAPLRVLPWRKKYDVDGLNPCSNFMKFNDNLRPSHSTHETFLNWKYLSRMKRKTSSQ